MINRLMNDKWLIQEDYRAVGWVVRSPIFECNVDQLVSNIAISNEMVKIYVFFLL